MKDILEVPLLWIKETPWFKYTKQQLYRVIDMYNKKRPENNVKTVSDYEYSAWYTGLVSILEPNGFQELFAIPRKYLLNDTTANC